MKKVFDEITDVSADVTKSMMVTSDENKKAIADLQSHFRSAIADINNRLLEKLNDRGILSTHMLSPVSKVASHENF